jgi:putative cell wall-binding protein
MTRHTHRYVGAALLAGAALVAMVAAPASATAGVTAGRLSGPDRYGTAAAIATATYPKGVPNTTAILVSGTNFPDALSAAYLAGRLNAPILLTDPLALSSETSTELASLDVNTVDIVGGSAAVSNAVEFELQEEGYRTARISGADRYATAAAVAQTYPSSTVGSYGASGGPTAIVATGAVFADALAGGPIAFSGSIPILLTDPATLSASTQAALGTLGVSQVLLLGGTSAVSAAVANQIAALKINVVRVGGADRTDTAAMLATGEMQQLGWSLSHVNLATGADYPDALSGGPHAGALTSPILLTEDATILGQYTTAFLQANSSTISSIDVFGGNLAVSDATVSAAQQAAT